METVFGVGGTNEKGKFVMNAMQMIHGAFNIQNWQESEELRGLWKYVHEDEAENIQFKKLEEPVLSRW